MYTRQLLRQYQSLAAGCFTDDYATVAPPAGTIVSYTEAVANSCTDTYTTGSAVAKADADQQAINVSGCGMTPGFKCVAPGGI